MGLEIIYEEPEFLVINKPAGISVHKTSPQDSQRTVVDQLTEKYPNIITVGEDPLRPGIVHRLDKDTSGLMIVAKTNAAFFYFKDLFQTRTITKQYQALVYGHPPQAEGVIDAPLGKLGTRQTTQLKGKKALTEREAITEYRTLRKYAKYTLLEVSPKTGRTHQIRVHLKSIGTPIVGDPIYGPKTQELSSRLWLHAQRLVFTSPSGQSLALEIDPPQDLLKTLEGLPV